jgi:predicted RND superfamily exporter protein
VAGSLGALARDRVIPSVIRWARKWRLPVLTAAVAAAALSLIALRGLTFDADVLHLLPKQGRAVPAFEQFLQQFGSFEHLYVVFEAPEGHTVDDYQDEIGAFVARLKALPEIERVDAGLFGEGRDWRYLADRVLLVLSPARAKEALDRFGAARLPGEVASARELLSVPSPEVAAMVSQDPLGLFMLMRDQLQGAAASQTIDASRGAYVTKDGRAQLVLARPVRPPFDIDFSKQLFDQLARIEREARAAGATPHPNPLPAGGERGQDQADADEDRLPPLMITFAGGHRISIETEREVRAETVWNTLGSLAVILPLLFIAFRSPWLVAVGPLPSALAILMVLGMYAIAHVTLSAAATGAAAMLFGLGIDGVVLMFVAFRQGLSEGQSADDAVTAMGAPGGPASSMLLGMWTTAATFYGLTIIDFPSLQELGALIGHGMVLCGLLTLILVPALLPRRVTKRVPPLTSWWLARFVTARSGAIAIGAILLTIALGAAATRIRVDASLDKLRSTSAAADLEQRIATRFGLPRDVYLVIARGRDLESLLVDNEKLIDALARERPSLTLYAPSSLLPSQARQADAASRIRAAGLTAADVTTRLRAAAEEAGFREDTFTPFVNRLPVLLDATGRLTFDGFYAQGLDEVLGRTVARTTRGTALDADATDGYVVATYVYPSNDDDVRALRHHVEAFGDRMTLTGLPEVNRELAARFTPEFLQGLALGTALVLALIVFSFRRLDLTLLALVPTLLALIWAGGALALARVELDLFSVFAVMTFVGIGVDYGIHMVHRFQHADDTSEVIAQLGPVIMVAGGITLLGFGTLVTSSYPPLRSLGLISTVMIVTLMLSSLLVLPALLVRRRRS